MYIRIDAHDFVDMASARGRLGDFGADGWYALFEYLDADDDNEADIVAVCSAYTLFDSLAELNECYSRQYATLDELIEDTIVIPIPDSDSFIIANF